MATIKPFAAVRPRPELAARICELPYDVLSSAEARACAAGNEFSFFHVSKPEIDLPASVDPYDPEVYAQGQSSFARFLAAGWLRQDAQPCFYVYRQVMGAHAQLGLVAAASCEDYVRKAIRQHELTRPDKEDDRLRHIEALNAQTGPAFLAYRAEPALDARLAERAAESPAVDFTAADSVRHSAWVLDRAEDIAFIQSAFAGIERLYIADGHHRTAAAVRVYERRKGAGHSRGFLAVIFPHNQLQILAYHRVIKDLRGLTPDALLRKLQTVFEIHEPGPPQPSGPHALSLYFQGRWRTLRFRPQFLAAGTRLEQLDVALLQRHVLAPFFSIDDPRTSPRLSFVGGIRGPEELQRLVDTGEAACAFAMFPTRIEDLMAIADADGIMPPKSTWFEPKLRDAMFCQLL